MTPSAPGAAALAAPRLLPNAGAPALEERSAIPLAHAGAGIVWAMVGAALLGWGADDLAAGRWGAPRLLGATHALTLGWLLTVAVGVLHQIGPATMGVAPRSITAWRGLLPLLMLGTAMVVSGVVSGSGSALRAGWLAVVLALAGYAVVLLGPRRASPSGRRTAWRVTAAFAALAATFVLALVRILYGRSGVLPDLDALRLGHVALGLGGFGTLLGIGVGLQILPGFFGARDVPPQWGQRAFWGVGLSVVVLGVSAVLPAAALALLPSLRVLGVLLGAAGGVCFVVQGALWLRAARRVAADPTVVGAFAAIVMLGAASVVAALAVAGVAPAARVLAPWGVLMLPGWITVLITSVLLRVIPLMAWMERFGGRPVAERRRVRVAELTAPRVAWVAMLATAGGALLSALGAAAGVADIVRLGSAGLLIGAAALGTQLVLALWRHRTPLPQPA